MADHVVAVPILPARDMAEVVEFWSRVPHLTVDEYAGGGYAFVRHQGAEVIHLGHFPDVDPSTNRAGCYLHVTAVDDLRREFVHAGVPASEVVDEPWGMREFRVTDPSGNLVRLGCGSVG
ncbi:hypothetical protein Acsp06_09000 [Actinomycetospora sp. NBRC 106375]|uniref:bleomycin resistance protein n=1 Tax=Actinomycetospora sp. NBRC 106375 TaxID=3032207 RepID=UPI0024A37816|nr:VOC family protein [Actinomycetospora sp. NBRC 106375]GLZ44715.1 hypothetical protein Acsp06_09000 [Actinomycetospora sp. NBRC 106375]